MSIKINGEAKVVAAKAVTFVHKAGDSPSNEPPALFVHGA